MSSEMSTEEFTEAISGILTEYRAEGATEVFALELPLPVLHMIRESAEEERIPSIVDLLTLVAYIYIAMPDALAPMPEPFLADDDDTEEQA